MAKRYHGVHRYLLGAGSRWAMSSAELRVALGLPAKLPADFEWSGTHQGIDIVVRPKTKRGMEKRVFARCPECGGITWIEAGHLSQHVEAYHA